MKRKLAGLGIVMIFFSVLPAYADAPLSTVQANVDKILEVLRDPSLKADSAKETKKERLRSIYKSMFDEVELSRRTLARNWNKLNTEERREFVEFYQQVLEKAYIDKILSYTNEEIAYERETRLAENQVEVQTVIITSSKKIPISYRVILSGGTWKVYDVIIENVSLVLNYRTQFNTILEKNTPEGLLEILRKKVEAQ